MIKIKTTIDNLFSFIEEHSPVREGRVPKQLRKLETFEKHIRVLETSGLIEVRSPLFSSERIFLFKSNERSKEYDPWNLRPLNF
jgi:hypothetical protein